MLLLLLLLLPGAACLLVPQYVVWRLCVLNACPAADQHCTAAAGAQRFVDAQGST